MKTGSEKIDTTIPVAGMREAIDALDECLAAIEDCALLPDQHEYAERQLSKVRGRLLNALHTEERRLLALLPPA
jgi:hypothetical protein